MSLHSVGTDVSKARCFVSTSLNVFGRLPPLQEVLKPAEHLGSGQDIFNPLKASGVSRASVLAAVFPRRTQN